MAALLQLYLLDTSNSTSAIQLLHAFVRSKLFGQQSDHYARIGKVIPSFLHMPYQVFESSDVQNDIVQ